MSEVEISATTVYGVLVLKPIEYTIQSRSDGWWITCEFSRQGPYRTRGAAETDLGFMTRALPSFP